MVPFLWIIRANSVRQTGVVDDSYKEKVKLSRSWLGLVLNGTGSHSMGTIWREEDGAWHLRTSDRPELVRVYSEGSLEKLLEDVPKYCLLIINREVYREIKTLRTSMGVDGMVHVYEGELATSGNVAD